MRIQKYRLQEGKLPLATIFTVGIFAGMILVNFGKSILLENTGLLDEYTLYHMKYMTVDGSALFYYILKQRLSGLLILAVLSTTYLGLVVCGGITLWYGMCAGVFLATAVIRYGLKGILLVVVGIFPQYLIYVPAMVVMLFWCQNLYRGIYLDRTYSFQPKCLLQLVVIFFAFFVGCVLESFLNPYLLQGLLKIF